MITTLDLNSDLGEVPGADGKALDAALLRVVTSANVACGGHAGDAESMARVCSLAVEGGVAIGAQVSYVDRAGFGRVRIEVSPEDLTVQLAEQISILQSHASAAGGAVAYLKPHGALYHAAAIDPAVAAAVIGAIRAYGEPLPVLTLPESALAACAQDAGLRAYAEAFADRGYLPDGGLVSRSAPGALVTDPVALRARVERLVDAHAIVAIDGTALAMSPASLCVHCDTPGAADIAALVRTVLEERGVRVAAFTAT